MLKQHYKKFRNNKYIAKFASMLGAKNLWAFNRDSSEKAIALGVACAWIPMPFHSTIAAFLAVIIDCNILLTITAIWFANPLTMPFMYYCAYQLGIKLLNVDASLIHFHFTVADMLNDLHLIWQPFLLGCALLGIACGTLTYLLLHFIWPSAGDGLNKKSRN